MTQHQESERKFLLKRRPKDWKQPFRAWRLSVRHTGKFTSRY